MPILSVAVLVLMSTVLFLRAGKGMLNDPGLGWHLRIADLMWESGAFLHTETFSTPSLGRPFITYSWLGDVLMWLSERWGGLNGVAMLASVTYALVLEFLFVRIVRAGAPWVAAFAWTWAAALAILPMAIAIPNMFTFAGLVVVVAVAEGFHAGTLGRRQTLWLVPLFLFWVNAHSGVLSGILALVVVYAAELACAFVGDAASRQAARTRLAWWTGLGAAVFVATMANPNGWHLHEHLVRTASETWMQRTTTLGWLPPDFLANGWGWSELLVLLLPALLATSTRRPSAVSLALCLVFLHYALTGRRYTALWVVIVLPMLASLASGTALHGAVLLWLERNTSADFRARLGAGPGPAPWLASIAVALGLVLASRYLPPVARITLPTAALDRLLEEARPGERVFHDANWGGYLTWYGRDRRPPFETWIDDRLDVHGPELLREYRDVLNAAPGWEALLDRRGFDLVCLPASAQVSGYLRGHPGWTEVYADEKAVLYRRRPTKD